MGKLDSRQKQKLLKQGKRGKQRLSWPLRAVWFVAWLFLCLGLLVSVNWLAANPENLPPFILKSLETYVVQPLTADLDIQLTSPVRPIDSNTIYTANPVVPLIGKTSTPGQVELILDNVQIAKQTTDDEGNFRFERVKLRSGENELRMRAISNIGWRKLAASFEMRLILEPDPPLTPFLFELPAKINNSSLTIRGTTEPEAKVLITVSHKDKVPEVLKLSTQSDREGYFQVSTALQKPGNYMIMAQTERSPTKRSFLTQPVSLIYDPSWRSSTHSMIARTLAITIASDQTDWDLVVNLPTDDPRAIALVTGQQPFSEFIGDILPIAVNQTHIISAFINCIPAISISDPDKETGRSTTTISAGRQVPSALPWWGGKVMITGYLYRQKQFLQEPDDILTVKFKEHLVQSYNPQPSTLKNEEQAVATWKGERDDIDLSKGIIIQTTKLTVGQTGGLVQILKFSPYDWVDILPPLMAEFFRFLLSLIFSGLMIIPMVWMLYFFRQDNRLNQRTNLLSLELLVAKPISGLLEQLHRRRYFNAGFEKVTQRLITICFIPTILSLISSVSGLLGNNTIWGYVLSNPEWFDVVRSLEEGLGFLFADYRFTSSIASFLCLLLLALLEFIIGRFLHRPFPLWLQVSFQGLFGATWIAILLVPINALSLILMQIFDERHPILEQVIATLIGFLLIRLLYILPKRIYESQWKVEPISLGRFYGLVILLGLILSCPFDISTVHDYFSTIIVGGSSAYNYLWNFLYRSRDLMPYILLFGIVLRLKQEANILSKSGLEIGTLLFSCYLVGTSSNLMTIPIPFLLALWVFPKFLITSRTSRWKLDLLCETVQAERKTLLSRVTSRLEPDNFNKTLDNLEKKVIVGDLSLEDFEKRKREITAYTDNYEQTCRLGTGLKVRDVALGFGPKITNWENGIWAIQRSLPLIIFLFILFVPGLLESQINENYFLAGLSSQMIMFIFNWLIAAFFFGYFFTYIRGESGLKKGLTVSVAIVISFLPVWLILLQNPVALLFQVGRQVFFFTVLGLWAFDHYTLRNTLDEQFSWRKFFQFTDLPNLTASTSVILASLSVAINSVLTGQFTSIVSLIIKSTLPELPTPPTTGAQ